MFGKPWSLGPGGWKADGAEPELEAAKLKFEDEEKGEPAGGGATAAAVLVGELIVSFSSSS